MNQTDCQDTLWECWGKDTISFWLDLNKEACSTGHLETVKECSQYPRRQRIGAGMDKKPGD